MDNKLVFCIIPWESDSVLLFLQPKHIQMVSNICKEKLISDIHDTNIVSGLTHNYYNYPARFSPQFSRSIIEALTNPGDVVIDPFMGGGTSIIESLAAGRNAIGIDINELAFFVSKVKTSYYSDEELAIFKEFSLKTIDETNIGQNTDNKDDWFIKGKLTNLNNKETWRLNRLLSLYKEKSLKLCTKIESLFKCALLKTAQWAFDNKREIPSLKQFRSKLRTVIDEFIVGAIELRNEIDKFSAINPETVILNRSAIGVERLKKIKKFDTPKLVITSPPYPGIHVLYHRWQIRGRKETSAPYWIANILDGHGEAYYTFGHRQQKELKDYYRVQYNAFKSLNRIIDKKTIVVQLLAFSDPKWQLPNYLKVMKSSGFREIDLISQSHTKINRIWRNVPNRKWYTQINKTSTNSKEVVLAHKLI